MRDIRRHEPACQDGASSPPMGKCGDATVASPHFFVEKFHTVSTLSTPPFFVPKPFSHYVSTTYEIIPKVGTQIVI